MMTGALPWLSTATRCLLARMPRARPVRGGISAVTIGSGTMSRTPSSTMDPGGSSLEATRTPNGTGPYGTSEFSGGRTKIRATASCPGNREMASGSQIAQCAASPSTLSANESTTSPLFFTEISVCASPPGATGRRPGLRVASAPMGQKLGPGFQGQKCSACSRVVVHQDLYDEFLERLKATTEKIAIGLPEDNVCMGPVINQGAMQSILNYIEIGKREGRLITGGERAPGDGYFIQPTVIADLDPMSRLSQEEVFGPVLAVVKAKDFDDALEIANNTDYGLTGSVYTTSVDKIERAKREFHVGNLYINRKCTGAVVGAHPFGGFKMSGTDSKAGGTDYLYLFSQAKSIGQKL